ncbi:MAG: UbiD family decarboxylase [Planctomycetota bacterium]|jgi:4-hydroxy-3-polyprenylbenzoate decarboxylase
MHPNLRDFLAALEKAGELRRIRAPVSPILEPAEIADRQAKLPCPQVSEEARRFDPGHCDRGGHALLFENVEGCDFPLLLNAYGSYRRTEMALGASFPEIAKRLESLTRPTPPGSFREILRKAGELLPLLRVPPRRMQSGPCQEIVKLAERGEVDVTRLPHIRCWPLAGDPEAVGYPLPQEEAGTAGGDGRYVTFAGIHTIHPRDEGVRKPASHNIGMYRVQLVGPTRMVMHWHMHHDGAGHWRAWKRAKRPMPIAICFGGESVLPYAATAPLPPGISELLMAGFLNRRGIPMVRARTVPLWVPANSEIVIEGWVNTECGFIGYDPREGEPLGPGAAFEGPFGDHTGYYSLPDRYPELEVTALTHRSDAIYPSTIVGYPPQEDYYLGKATERIFLPLLRTILHDLEDYHLPLFGCFHNCAFVKIRKEYPLQARRVMHAVWGAGQMAWTKVIVVVDQEVDVHDEPAVWRAVFENCDFGRDIETVRGPLDILDHAAPRLGAGHKIGIDATRKMRGEGVHGVDGDDGFPGVEVHGARGVFHPDFGRGRCAFVSVEKKGAGDGMRAAEDALRKPLGDFVIAVDASVDLSDPEAVFFQWCANFDPGRDMVALGGRVGFDATRKVKGDERNGQPVRDYPPPLEMTAEIRERVADRWSEYGLA